MGGLAALDQVPNFHVRLGFELIPTTITHTVREACGALIDLYNLGIMSKVMEFIRASLGNQSDADVVGSYGTHSNT